MAEKVHRSQMNQVEINACWVEAVRKENKNRILNENFDFNPKNLVAITEKPTAVRVQDAATLQEQEKELEMLKTKLDTLNQLPKKKFAYPQTTSQELGWDMDTEFDVYKPKYQVNKKMCAETKYASDYVTMTKRSPYAMKRPEGAQAPPK